MYEIMDAKEEKLWKMHISVKGWSEEAVMITNQILLNTIEGLKGISRVDFCIFDTEEKVLASTFEDSQMFEGSVRSLVESQV